MRTLAICALVGVGLRAAGMMAEVAPPRPVEPGMLFLTYSQVLMPLRDKALRRPDYKLTDAQDGVRFDLDGDGIEEQTAWTDANSGLAFLALDRNGNGKINNGKELFGNFTRSDSSNGFEALLRQAGPYGAFAYIEDGHSLFEMLLLWEDENHNGISESFELHKFSDHYVGIGLGYGDDPLTDERGNQFKFKGDASIRLGASKKRPQAVTRCDEGPFGSLRNCVLDRSEEQARHVDIYDVFFVQR